MRCPDCQKFVSLELNEEPELNLEVDAEGHVTGTARLVRTCAECSTEMKEANFEPEIDLTAEVAEHRKTCMETDLSVEGTASSFEDVERKDRNGKPITNPRYQKTLFGVEVEATVTCGCGTEFTGEFKDSTYASAMDELG